jgi:hypothetical protein
MFPFLMPQKALNLNPIWLMNILKTPCNILVKDDLCASSHLKMIDKAHVLTQFAVRETDISLVVQ